jgi:hypothetical protein
MFIDQYDTIMYQINHSANWLTMSSARNESEETPQNEIPDFIIPINNERSQIFYGLDIVFKFSYRSKEAAILSRLNHQFHRLFQPKLNRLKPYHDVIKHVFYAGPLEKLEEYIRRNPLVLLQTFSMSDMQGTLVELAVIGLDQTLRSSNGTVLSEGAEAKMLQLHEEMERQKVLPPGSHQDALEKAQRAGLQETAAEKATREANNVAAVGDVFNAFVGDDRDTPAVKAQKITDAINIFERFMKNLKQQMTTNGIMTTNKYHVNLIHLNAVAFDVLSKRGGTLQGQWYGALGDRFCFEVIGGAIQSKLPPRARQLLRGGIYYLFNTGRQITRDLDVNGLSFKSLPSGSAVLGLSLFYDDFGGTVRVGALEAVWCTARAVRHVRFYNLLKQFYQPPILTPRPTL